MKASELRPGATFVYLYDHELPPRVMTTLPVFERLVGRSARNLASGAVFELIGSEPVQPVERSSLTPRFALVSEIGRELDRTFPVGRGGWAQLTQAWKSRVLHVASGVAKEQS